MDRAETLAAVLEAIVGARVAGVMQDLCDGVTTLALEDGRAVLLTLKGDCCSSSSFTDPGQFSDLVGATILRVEDRCGQSNNNLPAPEGSDVLSWHFLVFTTDKGHITIDWHNDSNGYYDGWLIAELRTP